MPLYIKLRKDHPKVSLDTACKNYLKVIDPKKREEVSLSLFPPYDERMCECRRMRK
jgi:hypothetical protein